eukprot:361165-Chlamydomonas_euryale.AAC.1
MVEAWHCGFLSKPVKRDARRSGGSGSLPVGAGKYPLSHRQACCAARPPLCRQTSVPGAARALPSAKCVLTVPSGKCRRPSSRGSTKKLRAAGMRFDLRDARARRSVGAMCPKRVPRAAVRCGGEARRDLRVLRGNAGADEGGGVALGFLSGGCFLTDSDAWALGAQADGHGAARVARSHRNCDVLWPRAAADAAVARTRGRADGRDGRARPSRAAPPSSALARGRRPWRLLVASAVMCVGVWPHRCLQIGSNLERARTCEARHGDDQSAHASLSSGGGGGRSPSFRAAMPNMGRGARQRAVHQRRSLNTAARGSDFVRELHSAHMHNHSFNTPNTGFGQQHNTAKWTKSMHDATWTPEVMEPRQ